VPSEDVADVQWPIQAQLTPPAATKTKGSRKHKFARSSEKRKQRVAHDAKPGRPVAHTRKDRRERIRAGVDGHHADNSASSRVKAAAFTQAAAH
jgi:hypothetical protein